ncbi:MAG: hypothetical protein IJW55_09420 [Clostridia bacterium]|nr:hypothetical protein [Clostridia bacterium]
MKNKILKRIFAVLGIVLVLLSVMVVPISADGYDYYTNAWYILPIIDGRDWFAENYSKAYGIASFPDMMYAFSSKSVDFGDVQTLYENYGEGEKFIGTGYFGFYVPHDSNPPRSSFHAKGYFTTSVGDALISEVGDFCLTFTITLKFVSTTENRIVSYSKTWYRDYYNRDDPLGGYAWFDYGYTLTHTLNGNNVMNPISVSDRNVSLFLAYNLSETVTGSDLVYSFKGFAEGCYGLTDDDYYLTFPDEYACGYSTGYENGYYTGEANGLGTGYTNGYEAGYADGETDTYLPAYNEGVADGNSIGYENGYTDGYDVGHTDGEAVGEQTGYANGYAEGEKYGWDNGFGAGQNDMAETQGSFKDMVFAVFDAPVTLIDGMLGFEIFGINLAGLVKTIITMAVVAVIVFAILKFSKG